MSCISIPLLSQIRKRDKLYYEQTFPHSNSNQWHLTRFNKNVSISLNTFKNNPDLKEEILRILETVIYLDVRHHHIHDNVHSSLLFSHYVIIEIDDNNDACLKIHCPYCILT